MSFGVDGVTVRFGRTVALDNVTLEVRSGAVTCVVGGDGAGKSTLARVLGGALRPDEGEVHRPPAGRIGYMSAGSGTYGDLSVDENLAFSASAYGIARSEVAERVDEYLDRAGLTGARDRLASHLSGGMRQKLGVVRALAHRPDLLVLDEPTTGVDPVSRADLWTLIAHAAAAGAAVLVTTTYLDEAERAAVAILLDEGRVLASGPPSAVVAPLRRQRTARPARQESPGGPRQASDRAVGSGDGARDRPPLAQALSAECRFGRVAAVDGVDLEVERGEIVGLLGANGAGKTTLIRMLLGLARPTAGSVLLFGEPPSRQALRRVGYVPQSLGLYDDLTPAENLAFARAAFGRSGPAGDAIAALPELTVGNLPLGEQRRVAFAEALDHDPQLLVLDEPTSGVSPAASARLWETIRDATRSGAGALVTTHNLDEAELCDRLVIMAEGNVVAAGTLESVIGSTRTVVVTPESWTDAYSALEEAGLTAALVGTTLRVPGASIDRIREALGSRAATLEEAPASLEERFCELVSAPAGAVPR